MGRPKEGDALEPLPAPTGLLKPFRKGVWWDLVQHMEHEAVPLQLPGWDSATEECQWSHSIRDSLSQESLTIVDKARYSSCIITGF